MSHSLSTSTVTAAITGMKDTLVLSDRIVAHRGYRKAYPENTLLAHRKAIAAGARYIETDIMLSADRQPVLYHDPTLKRVSNRSGRVDTHTARELLTFPAYEPKRFGERFIDETITPLSELVTLLQQQPQASAYIDIKKEATLFAGVADTYTAVTRCLESVASQCPLISHDYDLIVHARTQGWQQCGVILNRWQDLSSKTLETIKPDVVFCNYWRIPRAAKLQNLDFKLVVYEIAKPRLAIKYLHRGADKIETFNIDGMIQALSQKTL